MRCAVAIFAKTLGLTPVKTRLAATIGQDKADAFYKLSVECVEMFVAEAGEAFPESVYPVWVVAEEDGPYHWSDRSFPAIWTGEGGLGTRLANVSEHLFETYDAVMMIGTDSPHLQAPMIIDTVSRLAGGVSNAVCGPAKDGGFYLFASKVPVSREIWEQVTYSSDSTLSDLATLIEAENLCISYLQKEQDVDVVADLATLKAELTARASQLNAAQQKMLVWLEEESAYLESAE